MERDKAGLTKKLEVQLGENVKQFNHMIKMIPDKYLYTNLKNTLMTNKENDVDRVIKARVKYKIAD